ncbi:hypothetical protein AFV9_gp63 [Betalipothrixvirus uzonense]|uniref:Uncharacterized protein n=1 Tax=Betalipothrixvirus uzonense TaxID=512792 RepID=B2CRP0_9VIRU|nr:hypothetical protein AFV9_gp63 [Acidianus filamentous virus 9]ACB37297.1 hypothetical protein [Acidianus filamentous virus 9]
MRYVYAKPDRIQVLSQIPPNAQKLWENNELALYYVYSVYYGEVDWIFVNKTDKPKYVSLLRGAEIRINGNNVSIPSYIFGDAFAEVYFANSLSSFITDLKNIPLYSLAILSDGSHSQIGFVFYLPPNGVVLAPEYGFYCLQSLNGELLEVSPQQLNLYAIIYDYAEIVEYEQQSGINVTAPPDPYAVFSYTFSIPKLGYPVTPRVILEIPQSDVNVVESLISDFKSFIDRIKKVL